PGPFSNPLKIKVTTSPTKFCEKDDLLICVRGSTGRTNVAGFKACIGRGVASIRSFIYQPYVNYFIYKNQQNLLEMGRGSTFSNITKDQLNEFPIPLPPLNEQKRIVAKVDQLMSLCDQLEE